MLANVKDRVSPDLAQPCAVRDCTAKGLGVSLWWRGPESRLWRGQGPDSEGIK